MVEIAIVGGGPGGLMTAWHLDAKVGNACQMTMFEAGHRLGGKLVTRRFPQTGALYEAGVAELYDYSHVGYDPLRELITDTLQLPIVEMDSEAVSIGDVLTRRYSELPEKLGKKTAKAIDSFRKTCAGLITPAQYYEGIGHDDNEHPWMQLSQEDILFREVDDDLARHYLRIAAHSDVAISPAQTSGLNALKNHVMDIEGYLGLYSIVGGNERLVDGLAGLLKANIELRTRVRRIAREADGRYRLTLIRNGIESSRCFDAVAICLPLNWLMTLEWGGERLQRAMSQHIGHFDHPAHYLRVTIAFRERFWAEKLLNQAWFMSDAFNGCCIYDESARHDHGGKGVLGWLIAGHDALAMSALSDAELVQLALDSLPAELQMGRALMVEADVQRWPYSVNGIPGGRPVNPVKLNHMPEPKEHSGLILVGDYLFDATLNGVLDSADCASDLLIARIAEKDYENTLVKQGRPPRRSASGRMLPEPIGAAFYDNYRKSGPYEQVWSQFFDAAYLKDMASLVFPRKKAMKLLDLGSACGLTIGALRDVGLDAVGIENCRQIHARTPDKLKKFNILGDATDLPFPDGHFDVIHETCLCYLPEGKIRKALAEMRRVARRGVIFGSITADLDLDLMDRFELQRGIRKFATWWEWSELFFEAGFDLAVEEPELLDLLWQRTLAAGRGPGAWFDDSEALKYCLYKVSEDED